MRYIENFGDPESDDESVKQLAPVSDVSASEFNEDDAMTGSQLFSRTQDRG